MRQKAELWQKKGSVEEHNRSGEHGEGRKRGAKTEVWKGWGRRSWSGTTLSVGLQEASVNFVGCVEPLGRINETYNNRGFILELLSCQHKTS